MRRTVDSPAPSSTEPKATPRSASEATDVIAIADRLQYRYVKVLGTELLAVVVATDDPTRARELLAAASDERTAISAAPSPLEPYRGAALRTLNAAMSEQGWRDRSTVSLRVPARRRDQRQGVTHMSARRPLQREAVDSAPICRDTEAADRAPCAERSATRATRPVPAGPRRRRAPSLPDSYPLSPA